MLEAAGNFGSGFDWVFGGLADAWDLVGLERRDFVAVSKLTFVVQSPGVDIASHGESDSELLAHLEVHDCGKTSEFFFLRRCFASTDTPRIRCDLLYTIAENNLCWKLANCLLFNLRILRNVLIVSTCTPLVH